MHLARSFPMGRSTNLYLPHFYLDSLVLVWMFTKLA